MSRRIVFVFPAIVAALFMAGSSVLADDPVLTLWQRDVRLRQPGVHECGNTLFVTVRLPVAPGDDPEEKEMEASAAAHDALVKWAWERTAAKRSASADDPAPGVRRARALAISSSLPARMRSWRVETNMREFVDASARDAIVLGQAFDKDALVSSIPASFSEPIDQVDWRGGLSSTIRTKFSKPLDFDFCRSIGALDALVASDDSTADFPQWNDADFQTRLDSFFKTHIVDDETVAELLVQYFKEHAASVRAEALEVLHATWTTNTIVEARPGRSSTNTMISVSTNILSIAGNGPSVRRLSLTPAEMIDHGMPVSASVSQKVAPLLGFTIMTNVITTIEVVHEAAVSVQEVRWEGEPRFQMLFLSAGILTNQTSRPTQYGKAAARSFYDQSMSKGEKADLLHDALCENPGDVALWNLYGRVFLDRGDAVGAIASLRNALHLDLSNEFVWANLATAWASLGKEDRAIGAALVARGLAKSDWTIKMSEAILMKTGKSGKEE